MKDFNKIVRIGTQKTYGGRAYSVYCRIDYSQGELSITGVEGPLQSGNCIGACGQIVMGMNDEYLKGMNFAPDWNTARAKKFFAIWERWHLNRLRAGTPRQEAYLRELKSLGISYDYRDGSYYRWAYNKLAEVNLAVDDNNGQPYMYGHSWLTEPVPEDVLAWLYELPVTDREPAWV
jgi:hypothetical protein